MLCSEDATEAKRSGCGADLYRKGSCVPLPPALCSQPGKSEASRQGSLGGGRASLVAFAAQVGGDKERGLLRACQGGESAQSSVPT